MATSNRLSDTETKSRSNRGRRLQRKNLFEERGPDFLKQGGTSPRQLVSGSLRKKKSKAEGGRKNRSERCLRLQGGLGGKIPRFSQQQKPVSRGEKTRRTNNSPAPRQDAGETRIAASIT